VTEIDFAPLIVRQGLSFLFIVLSNPEKFRSLPDFIVTMFCFAH